MSNPNKAEKRLTSGDLPFDEMDSLSRQERLWLKSLQDNIVKDWPQKLLQKQWFTDAQWKVVDISSNTTKLQEQKLLITKTTKSVVLFNHKWVFISKNKRSQRESAVLDWYANLITYWDQLGWLTQEHKDYILKELITVDKNSTSVDQQKKIDNLIMLCRVASKPELKEQKQENNKLNNASETATNTSKFESWYEISKTGSLYAQDGEVLKQMPLAIWTKILVVSDSIKNVKTVNWIKELIRIKRDNQEAWVEKDIFQKLKVAENTPAQTSESSQPNETPTKKSNNSESSSVNVELSTTIVTKYVNVRSHLNTRIVDGAKVWTITTTKLSKGDKVDVDTGKTTTTTINNVEYDFVQVVKINDKDITPVWVASKYLTDDNISVLVSKPKSPKVTNNTSSDNVESKSGQINDITDEVVKKTETEEIETEEEKASEQAEKIKTELERQMGEIGIIAKWLKSGVPNTGDAPLVRKTNFEKASYSLSIWLFSEEKAYWANKWWWFLIKAKKERIWDLKIISKAPGRYEIWINMGNGDIMSKIEHKSISWVILASKYLYSLLRSAQWWLKQEYKFIVKDNKLNAIAIGRPNTTKETPIKFKDDKAAKNFISWINALTDKAWKSIWHQS